MRYCCLACGGFWKTKDKTPICCPYCNDKYYCDNVIENVPPVVKDVHRKCEVCGFEYYVESISDNTVCPICGKCILNEKVNDSMRLYQKSILKMLGI